MTTATTHRCEHLACLCEIPLPDAACSPYCGSLEGADVENIICNCGHDHCKAQIETQLHGGAGSER